MSTKSIEPLIEFSNRVEFKGSKQVEFCQNSRYLTVYGIEQIQVVDMEGDEDNPQPKLIDSYKLDTDNFKGILDIQI